MKVLVVYESVFGNTEVIAKAIGDGLAEEADVIVTEVGQAPIESLGGFDLIVVGGPVHAFGMSRANSRRDGARNAGMVSITGNRGLREWFKDIDEIGDVPAAAFDTRIEKILGVLPVGSARRGIAKRLKDRGCRLIDDGEGFFVTGTEGPLEEGEIARARRWGITLAEKVASAEGAAAV